MREFFFHHRFEPLHEALLHAANCEVEWGWFKGIPLTSDQLLNVLDHKRVLHHANWTGAAFRKLCHRGLLAGRLDWNLCPVGPIVSHVPKHAAPRVELLCRTPGLEAWVTRTLRRAGRPVAATFSRGNRWFSPHHLLTVLGRLDDRLDEGPVRVVFFSRPYADSPVVYNHLTRVLTRMVRTRRARRRFNAVVAGGKELWLPGEGLVPPRQGKGQGLRNRVSKFVAEADGYVRANLSFAAVTPPAAWEGLTFEQVDPADLSRLLFDCLFPRDVLERVPKT